VCFGKHQTKESRFGRREGKSRDLGVGPGFGGGVGEFLLVPRKGKQGGKKDRWPRGGS